MSKAERRLRRAYERTRAGKAERVAREVERRKALIRASIQADVEHNEAWGATRDSFNAAIGVKMGGGG